MKVRSVCLAAMLAGGLLVLPADAQEQQMLDYQAVRDALPKLREMSNEGTGFSVRLHKVMDALDGTNDPTEQKRLRGELRLALSDYRELKQRQMASIRPLLALPSTNLSDREILDKLRTTELHSVVWDDTFFDKCIRDLSGAIGVPIRLQHRVVQKNTVGMRFQKVPAEMILATLCNGFDLRYVIQGGEIVIFKKITPTEERFLDYQKRHPEVKLKYWEKEDASGHVDTSKGGDK